MAIAKPTKARKRTPAAISVVPNTRDRPVEGGVISGSLTSSDLDMVKKTELHSVLAQTRLLHTPERHTNRSHVEKHSLRTALGGTLNAITDFGNGFVHSEAQLSLNGL
jgi:hypothetical protein